MAKAHYWGILYELIKKKWTSLNLSHMQGLLLQKDDDDGDGDDEIIDLDSILDY